MLRYVTNLTSHQPLYLASISACPTLNVKQILPFLRDNYFELLST